MSIAADEQKKTWKETVAASLTLYHEFAWRVWKYTGENSVKIGSLTARDSSQGYSASNSKRVISPDSHTIALLIKPRVFCIFCNIVVFWVVTPCSLEGTLIKLHSVKIQKAAVLTLASFRFWELIHIFYFHYTSILITSITRSGK